MYLYPICTSFSVIKTSRGMYFMYFKHTNNRNYSKLVILDFKNEVLKPRFASLAGKSKQNDQLLP
jgi:hypothetical protein